MPPRESGGYTDVQIAFWRGLTDQRVANLWEVADLIGDMNHDSREFLRSIGAPENKALLKFFREARPETLEFLSSARANEIEKLRDGIQYVVATQLLGRFGRWGLLLHSAPPSAFYNVGQGVGIL